MKRSILILSVLAAAWYAIFLFRNTVFVAGGSDSSGYANAARMLRAGKLTERVQIVRDLRLPDEWAPAFAPLGFWEGREPGTIVPTYPLGFPVHQALLSALLGERNGFFLVSPLMALLSLLVMFLLARELGVDAPWALVSVAVLAAFPTFSFFAIQPMSDVTALLWCTLAVLAALKAERRPWLAVLAGACFGMAVAVRPTNVLLVVPLAMVLRWKIKPLLLLALGAAPFAITLMALNQKLFGSPFETGYGPLSDLMALKYFKKRFIHYTAWLLVLLTPVVFPAGLFAKRRFLAAWFGVFFAFFCFYEHYDAWWYTRFLLPAIPGVIAGAMLVNAEIAPRLRAVLFAGVILVGAWWCGKNGVPTLERNEEKYRQAVLTLAPRIPQRSVIVAMQMSGALKFYDGRNAARFDLLNADRFQLLRTHAFLAGYDTYALLYDYEMREAREKTGASFDPVAHYKAVTLYRIHG